ncbi:MAG: uncharacterized protein QOH73_1851, partial [Gaiellaceae bacterium]|nr:uncharacterized protein [Gaiellaceae bacterium]
MTSLRLMRDRYSLFAGLALLAVAFLIGALAIAGGISNRGNNDTLTVTGSAKKAIVSDFVVWSASLSAQDFQAANAAKQLAGWSKRVEAFLDAQGV